MSSSTTESCSDVISTPWQGAVSVASLISLGCLLNCWHDEFLAVGCQRAVVGQTLILAHYASLMTVIESHFIGKNKLPFYMGRRILPPMYYIIKFVIFISNAFQK